MQIKIAHYTEFKELLAPNYKRSYAAYSPFPLITSPSGTVFTTWSGTQSQVSGPSVLLGGFEVCRIDPDDPVLFNFDYYPIYSTATPSLIELNGPRKLTYHWVDSLPIEMQRDAPDWVINLTNRLQGGRIKPKIEHYVS